MISLLGLSLLFYPLNYESRFERTANQATEAVHPQNFALGFQKDKWRGIFEYANYSVDSGTAAYKIRRTHRDFLLEGGYNFVTKSWAPGFEGKIYGGAGVGTFRETVETTLVGISSKDQGTEKLTGTLLVGAGIRYKFLVAELEGRPLFGENYDPQPQWSYVFRLGVQIALGGPEKKSISSETGNKKPDVINHRVVNPKK